MANPTRKAAGGIIAGTNYKGDPIKVLVDDDGAIILSDDANIEAVQIALLQGILKTLRMMMYGMQEEYMADFDDLDEEAEDEDDNESVN